MSELQVELDPESPVPPYAQLEQQLRTMMAAGVLVEGMKLPTIRQLAADLGLASGTVARVYRELERDGLISTKVRRGTIVNATPQLTAHTVRQRLEDAARGYVSVGRQLGADAAAMEQTVQDVLAEGENR